MKKLQYILLTILLLGLSLAKASFEDEFQYPLMGDYTGQFVGAKIGYERSVPKVCAQVMPITKDEYEVVLLPTLYNRSPEYIRAKGKFQDGKIIVDEAPWYLEIENDKIEGKTVLNGHDVTINMKKSPMLSPTLAMKPPAGAKVVFDGTSTDAFVQKKTGKPFSWALVDSVMQTVSFVGPTNIANKKNGLGGDIITKESFKIPFKMHLEFRYGLELGEFGQRKGNSGVFLGDLEVQVLNSYMTPGCYDEAGSFYKIYPPRVNAASVPFQWQTYDIEVSTDPETKKPIVTVLLNGIIVQNKMPIENIDLEEVKLSLQDHLNTLQYRNIFFY